MPGGVSYRCVAMTIGGTSKYDLLRVRGALSADMLYNRADCRKYPQQAASTNHSATLSATTLDLSNAAQSSASSPLPGSSAGSVVVTASGTSTGTMVYTLNPAVWVDASFDINPQTNLSELTMNFEAAGTDGNEPTVTWATGS